MKTRRLKAKLALSGLTYAQFAAFHNFKARTVKAAVRGERAGPMVREVVKEISRL